jgi:hypothetical protein
MKQKKEGKKLSLNKNTVASLEAEELKGINGGASYITSTDLSTADENQCPWPSIAAECFTEVERVCCAATYSCER